MSETYPATYPLPETDRYETDADFGVVEAEFRPGPLTSRRDFNRPMPSFRLSFVIEEDLFDEWLAWVQANAWRAEGIGIDLPGFATTASDGTASPHEIRFTSRLTYTYPESGPITVAVEAEVIAGGEGRLQLGGAGITDDIDEGNAATADPGDAVDEDDAATVLTDAIEEGGASAAHA